MRLYESWVEQIIYYRKIQQALNYNKKVYLPTCAAQDSGIEYGRQEIKQELDTDDVYQSL